MASIAFEFSEDPRPFSDFGYFDWAQYRFSISDCRKKNRKLRFDRNLLSRFFFRQIENRQSKI